jgi:small conductance mechanosensitive channel
VTWPEVLALVTGAPLRIVGIVVGAMLLRWVLHRAITGAVERTVESSLHERLAERRTTRVLVEAGGVLPAERRRQRAQTIGSVLRSIASFTIFGVAFAMVLGELGVQLGPLLASAGVVGVALGFGAQSLVRDFLSGIFLILEDQYGVGDVVDVGSVIGTVESIGLRVTRLRDGDGVVWYVRNGEILRVGNRSQGWSTAVVDIPVAYAEDLSRVEALIAAAAVELAADPQWSPLILEDPEVAGVEALSGDTVVLRVLLKCAPNENAAVQREFRSRIKAVFDREGVRVPVPVRPGWEPAPGVPRHTGSPSGPPATPGPGAAPRP